MSATYRIHPSIGIARVGNSDLEFYIEPTTTGGLPLECDGNGNEKAASGLPVFVSKFKDKDGRVKRQASKFRIFKVEGGKETEITLQSPDVASISWTVHLANKKAAWYQFSELQGNTLYSTKTLDNSYAGQKVDLRNKKVTTGRQKLIIDPGPRTISGKAQQVAISSANIPADYPFGSFPGKTKYGFDIDKLGDLLTDDKGRLLILGGMGNAGGDEPVTSFAGADSWHDDVGDGSVVCTLQLKGGETVTANAWVIVGSPKFAPEIDNICTLSDIMLDVAVRHQNALPEIFDPKKWAKTGGWNTGHVVNYRRDVEPIFQRPKRYQWVSNVQCMMSFASADIDFKDGSAANKKCRQAYFAFFRRPGIELVDQLTIFKDNIPMQPMNSGSNSVSNELIDKFLTLTPTQYFFLGQWAEGKFEVKPSEGYKGISEKDQATVGNCVGLPMCPGIEVTWSTQNPAIYAAPYEIKTRHDGAYYAKNGLSPDADETDGAGCEPGDLTKRMAIPAWRFPGRPIFSIVRFNPLILPIRR
jgi:L-lysine 6-oxidase